MPTYHRKLLALAVLFGAVLFAFGPTLDATFLDWDDDHNIYDNPHIRDLNAANLRWMFTDLGADVRYKPLGYVTWAVIHAGFGLNPEAYHKANVAIHALNSCLLFLVLGQFISRSPQSARIDEATRDLIALAGAAFWALHPLRVEPVAWACVLPYNLSVLFLLASLIGYLHVDFQKPWNRQASYWMALGTFTLSLLSFPISIGCMALFMALAIWPNQTFDLTNWRTLFSPWNLRALLPVAPFVAAAGAVTAIALYGALVRVGHFDSPPTLAEFPLHHRFSQGSYLLCLYVVRAVFPWDLRPFYTDLTNLDPLAPAFIISSLTIVVLTVYAARNRSRHPAVAALLLAHIAILLPVLGLTVSPHYPSDRHTITHGILISLALTTGMVALPTPVLRKRATTVVAIVCIMFAFTSRHLSHHWQNGISFFTFMADGLPDGGARANALMKRGNALSEAQRFEEAIVSYQAARKSAPAFKLGQLPFREGEAHLALGNAAAAVPLFHRALQLEPEQVHRWVMLAEMLAASSLPQDALGLLNKGLQHHPAAPQLTQLQARLQK